MSCELSVPVPFVFEGTYLIKSSGLGKLWRSIFDVFTISSVVTSAYFKVI